MALQDNLSKTHLTLPLFRLKKFLDFSSNTVIFPDLFPGQNYKFNVLIIPNHSKLSYQINEIFVFCPIFTND